MKLWQKIVVGTFLGLVVSIGLYFGCVKYRSAKIVRKNDSINVVGLPQFSATDLRAFDGSDDSKPIYMAVDGKVYDVSSGREFYKKGGVYHYLAGKDSTADLKPVGTDIITNKYPIIGTLSN